MSTSNLKGKWALILGASSGFGEACALHLAKEGVHIAGVHLDRRVTLSHAEEVIQRVQSKGVKALYFNKNAAAEETRNEVCEELKKTISGGKLVVVMHSLAFGTLKDFIGEDKKKSISQKQIEMTHDVMAHSLVYWVQDLLFNNLIGKGTKVFAMTSAGGHSVWPTYGAVSGAKAALESHVRQLAFELAGKEIAVNCIQAGVTETPALKQIPGHEEMVELSKRRNPHGRLTTTDDVAKALVQFCSMEGSWMTGNVIRVDGGEDLIG